MIGLLDRCAFTPTAGGTGDWAVSAAVPGFQTPQAAGATDAYVYSFFAQSADLSQWEYGRYTWNNASATMQRTTILGSSNGGAKVNFSSPPTVCGDALAEDVKDYDFDTLATAQAAHIPAIYNSIRTANYYNTAAYPGDIGGGNYIRWTGATTGGFQSADGAWWKLNEDVVNVCMFGAYRYLGAQSGNDSASAFQNAINYVAFEGGTLRVPAGNYFIGTGLSIPNHTVAVNIIGDGKGSTNILCTADITAFTVNANYCVIRGLTLYGYNNVSAVAPVVHFVGVGNHIEMCRIWYGGEGVRTDQAAGDSVIEQTEVSYSYKAALHILGSAWVRRSLCDQDWPVSLPTYPQTVNNWSAGLNATVGMLVWIGNYLVQCSQGGTTASSAPSVVQFNAAIVESTGVTWQLAALATYQGMGWFEGVEIQIEQCDFSTCALRAITINNDSGGAVPNGISILQTVISQAFAANILCKSGADLKVIGCRLGAVIATGDSCIQFANSWSGPAFIADNYFQSSGYSAIALYAGSDFKINNNTIISYVNAGIYVAPGIGHFNISGNTISSCPVGVLVDAGAGNYFDIVNNMLDGCTTAVINDATGTNWTIENGEPWFNWTPTVTAGTGSIGALGPVIARYKKLGKTVHFYVSITITAKGTGGSYVNVTMPFNSAATSSQAGCGRENGVTGKMLQAPIFGNDNIMGIFFYDNTYPAGADGAILVVSGTYEIA